MVEFLSTIAEFSVVQRSENASRMLFFNCPDYYWTLYIMCVSVPAHVMVHGELGGQLSGVRSLLP